MKIEKSPFINRQADLTHLQEKGQEIARGRGEDFFFIAPRGSGKTALLKEVKELFFWGQKDLLPVYFSFSRTYSDLSDFFEDFLVKILSQILFFDQKKQVASSLSGTNRLAQIQWEAERQGKGIIGQIIASHKKAKGDKDYRRGLLNALTAPRKIAQATNRPIWVMIDHVQEVENLPEAEKDVIGPWSDGLQTPWAPHLFAGEPPGYIAKYLIPAFGPFIPSVLESSPITSEEGKALIDSLAKFFQVRLAEDHGADWFAYLGHNPGLFAAFIKEARRQNSGVESHQRFADLYLKSLWLGEMGRSLVSGFLQKTNPREGTWLLRILERLFYSEKNKATFDELQATLSLSAEELSPLLRILERAGLVTEHFGIIQLEDRQVLRDWLEILIRKYLRQEEVEDIFRFMGEKIEKRLSERAEEGGVSEVSTAKGLQFSLVLPVDSEVELVAVKALEQIATYTDLAPADIEKTKLALIEACINAGEHSQSFEKKIRIYFSAQPDTLEIQVEDRGRAFDPVEVQARMVRAGDPLSLRRGRGLSLIREMMDEIRFEKTEIGTRLYMLKKKNPPGKV